jgi:hypothetical protein
MTSSRRAVTEGQKRAVLDMIYQAWLAHPELRLGQLIYNAALGGTSDVRGACDWLYAVEDFELARGLK